jgi:EmrB/QacA subfamily drug resistance transporter
VSVTGSPAPPVAAQPVALGTAAGRWLVLVTVLASGMAFIDSTAVNVALPSIGRDLGSSLSGLQWTVTAYTLTLAALILLGGSLGDRYGRRRVFLIGVAWFATASLVCGLAQSPGQLIVARGVQGIGGALLTPGSLALIQSSFRPGDRAKAIGIWSSLGGVAGLIGPVLGGFLVDAASWRWVFLLNVPVAVLVLAAARFVPESRDEEATGRFDVLGAVLGAVALGGITYALITGGEHLTRPDVAVSAVVGIAAGVAFVVREQRAAHPMLPLGLFADRQFTGANLATLTIYGALAGGGLFIVLQLQNVLGYSAKAAGAALLPTILLLSLLSPRMGALATRIGPRLPMTVGPLVVTLGALWFSRLGAGSSYVVGVLPGSLLQGLGMALTVAPLTATVLGAAPTHLAGIASGVNNAVARAGGLLAVAALPVAVGLSGSSYTHPAAFTSGFRTAMYVCAALFALGGAVSWLTIRNDVLAGPSGG